ncbi:MAG: hypothetical protein QOC92_1474 [Acidimicrobiaceae bacterium]
MYIGVGIAAVAFLGLYVSVLKNFRDAGERKSEPFVLGDQQLTDGVAVDATVLNVDPIKGEMIVRLSFEPLGSFAAGNGTPSHDLKLLVSAGSGNVERPFTKGKLMAPTDVTLELFDGQVTNYPFDHHKAQLFAAMVLKPASSTNASSGASGESGTSSSAGSTTTGEETLVPISMHVFESLHGFSLDVADAGEVDDGTIDATLKADRASSTVVFAVFVMVLMWLLAIGALLLSLSVLVGGRKVELAMFGFLGSLLFAFPAIRNVVPGTPPIGSLNDYLAFFWTEAIVAVSLLIILSVWIFRPAR